MNFQSRITVQSALPGYEDVSFTLNKMTEGRRIKLRVKLADAGAKLREALAEAEDIKEQGGAKAAEALFEKVKAMVDDEITPAWVRWGLHQIAGLSIDDAPATVESLIEAGPRELYSEIVYAIKKEAGLTDTQQGESELPTTSDELVDGQKNSTSADLADSKATS